MLTVAWMLFKYRAETLALAQADLGHRARAVADELDGRVAATGQLLFGLGRVPLLDEDDPARCSAFLADVLKERPQYTGLLTIRPDGQLHCDSLRTGRKLDLRDRDYFRRALVSRGPVAELVIGRLTGKGVLQVAYPVREADGGLKYILLASLDMEIFGRDIARTLPYGAMHLQVWNRDASVILDYGNDPAGRLAVDAAAHSLMLSPAEGTTRLPTRDGPRLWAKALLSRYGDTGVGVALVAPEASLSARAVRQSRESAVILVLLGFACLAVAIAFAEVAVRRQTARLMAAISRLDGGDYRPQIGAPYPRGEIGQVMQALDRLADSLAQQRLEIARNTEALEHQARVDALWRDPMAWSRRAVMNVAGYNDLLTRPARRPRPTRPVSGVRSSAGADPGPERFPTETPAPAESAIWECSLILQSFEIAFQQFLGLRRKREFPPQLGTVAGLGLTVAQAALDPHHQP